MKLQEITEYFAHLLYIYQVLDDVVQKHAIIY